MDYLLALFVFAFSTTATPGPNNVMIMTSGLNFGIKRSIPHFLGICIGFPFMVLLVGAGLGGMFEAFPFMHSLVQIVGVVYLLYLAWKIACSEAAVAGKNASTPLTFIQSSLFQWVNPKAWMMATGAVAAFSTPDGNIWLQVLLIALAFFISAFPAVGIWLFFGVKLRRFLSQPKQRKIFNWVMAGLLVISILPVISDWF